MARKSRGTWSLPAERGDVVDLVAAMRAQVADASPRLRLTEEEQDDLILASIDPEGANIRRIAHVTGLEESVVLRRVGYAAVPLIANGLVRWEAHPQAARMPMMERVIFHRVEAVPVEPSPADAAHQAVLVRDVKALTKNQRATLRMLAQGMDWENMRWSDLKALRSIGVITQFDTAAPTLTPYGQEVLAALPPLLPAAIFERVGYKLERCVICDKEIRSNAMGRASHVRGAAHQAQLATYEPE